MLPKLPIWAIILMAAAAWAFGLPYVMFQLAEARPLLVASATAKADPGVFVPRPYGALAPTDPATTTVVPKTVLGPSERVEGAFGAFDKQPLACDLTKQAVPEKVADTKPALPNTENNRWIAEVKKHVAAACKFDQRTEADTPLRSTRPAAFDYPRCVGWWGRRCV